MTLKQIEAFYWAAKLGSFAIAAQRLQVTQSSLSKRVAELEESVGALLFDRTMKSTAAAVLRRAASAVWRRLRRAELGRPAGLPFRGAGLSLAQHGLKPQRRPVAQGHGL